MKRYTSRITTTVLALLLFSPVLFVRGLSQPDIQNKSVVSALNYLSRNYSASLGLVHESPDSTNFSNTYWLYSDNFLASLALQTAGRSNASLSLLAENLTRSIEYFTQGQRDTINQYQVFSNSFLFPFNASKDFTFRTIGVSAVKSTVNNQSGMLDPKKYADIAYLEAIAYHNKKQDNYAIPVFHDGYALWNGTGFKDTAFTSIFATYKIALYLYAARLLGQVVDSSMVDGLRALQSRSGVDSGGFLTGYDGKFVPANGSNTETTALAILALYQPDSMVSDSRLLVAGVVVLFAIVLIPRGRIERVSVDTEQKTVRFSEGQVGSLGYFLIACPQQSV